MFPAQLSVGGVTSPTVTVTVFWSVQPAGVVAVIVKVVVTKVPGVVLFNVPEIELPLPLEGIPVKTTLLFLVQVKVVPGILLKSEIVITSMAAPGHFSCVAGVAEILGTGLIVIAIELLKTVPQL